MACHYFKHQTHSQTFLRLSVFELAENKFSAWLFLLLSAMMPICVVYSWQKQYSQNNHSSCRGERHRRENWQQLPTLTNISISISMNLLRQYTVIPLPYTMVWLCRSYLPIELFHRVLTSLLCSTGLMGSLGLFSDSGGPGSLVWLTRLGAVNHFL